MTDEILETLKRFPDKAVSIDGRAWEETPFVIAGATHLSKRDQLKWWAEFHALNIDYIPASDVYVLSKRFSPSFSK